MKIAYISGRMFSDVDLSYLSHAQKQMDITYFVPIFKNRLTGAAFNLKKHFPKYGIFRAIDIYPELKKFQLLKVIFKNLKKKKKKKKLKE